MVYGVIWEGVIECSNTLEGEDNPELLPQALLYTLCRQLLYGLLLLNREESMTSNLLNGSLVHINIIIYNRFFSHSRHTDLIFKMLAIPVCSCSFSKSLFSEIFTDIWSIIITCILYVV